MGKILRLQSSRLDRLDYIKKVLKKSNIHCEYYYFVDIIYLQFDNNKLIFNIIDVIHFNQILKSCFVKLFHIIIVGKVHSM